jgi:hypothetical protein
MLRRAQPLTVLSLYSVHCILHHLLLMLLCCSLATDQLLFQQGHARLRSLQLLAQLCCLGLRSSLRAFCLLCACLSRSCSTPQGVCL